MAPEESWSKPVWESSVSSRCWWCTPFDQGWDSGYVADNDELCGIVAMETALGKVPDWARVIVERVLQYLPMCGHYGFPLAYKEALTAMGSGRPPRFLHTCFSVDNTRKEQMMDYVFCLDAWLAGAPPEHASEELDARASRHIDWGPVCRAMWSTLGEHDELKDLLVERLLHAQRHKIKSAPWHDDRGCACMHDRYLGRYVHHSKDSGMYVDQSGFVAAYEEASSPRVQQLNARLAEVSPESKEWLYYVTYGWLCAPKAFRYLERLIWAIGAGRPPSADMMAPQFLGVEDLIPDQTAAAEWWREVKVALTSYWRNGTVTGPRAADINYRLGEPTPVRRWLVRLFVARCQSYVDSDENRDGTLLIDLGDEA